MSEVGDLKSEVGERRSREIPLNLTVGGRGIVMDYPCAKFGDFSFSRFGFIVLTDRQRRIIAILITHATIRSA